MPALGTHPTAGGVLFALQGRDGTIPTSAPLRRDDTNTYDVLSVGGAAIDSGSILFPANSAVRIAANPVAAQYPRTIAGVFNVTGAGGTLLSLSWDDDSTVSIISNSGQVQASIRQNTDFVWTEHTAGMTPGSWVAVAFTEISPTSRILRVGSAKIVGPATSISPSGTADLWLTIGGLSRGGGFLQSNLPAGSRAVNIALWGAGHPNASMDDETWAAILASPDVIYASAGPVITGDITTDSAAPTGTLQSTPPSTLAGAIALDSAAPTGSLSSGAAPGTVLLTGWDNLSGMPLPNQPVARITLQRLSDGVQVLNVPGLTTSADPSNPAISITNASLAAGTVYLAIANNADGTVLGIERVQAV